MRNWNIDSAHSYVGFNIKHSMVSTLKGKFTKFTGSIKAEDDSFDGASVSCVIDFSSVNTHNDMRDGHLKSEDFFDVEKFPEMSFVSKSFVVKGEKVKIVGDLTIKGITKQVELAGVFNGIGESVEGSRVVGFDVVGKINRQDFNIVWNKYLKMGGVLISDEVELELHIEAGE